MKINRKVLLGATALAATSFAVAEKAQAAGDLGGYYEYMYTDGTATVGGGIAASSQSWYLSYSETLDNGMTIGISSTNAANPMMSVGGGFGTLYVATSNWNDAADKFDDQAPEVGVMGTAQGAMDYTDDGGYTELDGEGRNSVTLMLPAMGNLSTAFSYAPDSTNLNDDDWSFGASFTAGGLKVNYSHVDHGYKNPSTGITSATEDDYVGITLDMSDYGMSGLKIGYEVFQGGLSGDTDAYNMSLSYAMDNGFTIGLGHADNDATGTSETSGDAVEVAYSLGGLTASVAFADGTLAGKSRSAVGVGLAIGF